MEINSGIKGLNSAEEKTKRIAGIKNTNTIKSIPPKAAVDSPCKLNVLVDGACNHHCDNGIVPRAEKHQSEAQAHPQKGQSPAEQKTNLDTFQTQLPPDPADAYLTSGRT